MLKTEHKTYRLTAETVRMIAELGRRWGPVSPVSPSDVIRECVRRIHAAEWGELGEQGHAAAPSPKGARR